MEYMFDVCNKSASDNLGAGCGRVYFDALHIPKLSLPAPDIDNRARVSNLFIPSLPYNVMKYVVSDNYVVRTRSMWLQDGQQIGDGTVSSDPQFDRFFSDPDCDDIVCFGRSLSVAELNELEHDIAFAPRRETHYLFSDRRKAIEAGDDELIEFLSDRIYELGGH